MKRPVYTSPEGQVALLAVYTGRFMRQLTAKWKKSCKSHAVPKMCCSSNLYTIWYKLGGHDFLPFVKWGYAAHDRGSSCIHLPAHDPLMTRPDEKS